MPMDDQRWNATNAYLREVFGREPEALTRLRGRAEERGIPAIAVSSDVGRLLTLLTTLSAPGGAREALELGALFGYSAYWIAQGLAPGGRLITLEPEPTHAEFTRAAMEELGLADRVTVREWTAIEYLDARRAEGDAAPLDLVFLDAIKTEYLEYFDRCRDLLRPGGLLVADNALGADWWITDPPGSSEARDAVDRFNRAVARDDAFDVCCVPAREGVLIARRKP